MVSFTYNSGAALLQEGIHRLYHLMPTLLSSQNITTLPHAQHRLSFSSVIYPFPHHHAFLSIWKLFSWSQDGLFPSLLKSYLFSNQYPHLTASQHPAPNPHPYIICHHALSLLIKTWALKSRNSSSFPQFLVLRRWYILKRWRKDSTVIIFRSCLRGCANILYFIDSQADKKLKC